MKEFPKIFTIVDTETTGMRPPFSRIIDIGMLRVENGKVVERFQSLINPGVSVPYSIERLTNITNEDLIDAPPFEDIVLQVEEMLKGAVFVAHNAPFDYAFIKSEFSRLSMEYSAETLCSVKFSRAISPKSRSHNLDSIIDRYGIQLGGDRHRALPDAEAVWEFLRRANAEHSPGELRAAINRARAGGTLSAAVNNTRGPSAPNIARDTFTDLPDSAGVYFFYGPEQELLYIGKSKHVRTRARSHFHTKGIKSEERLQRETNAISSVRTSGELSALLLESALIKAQSPLYNKALRRRKQLVIAEGHTTPEGYQTLTLTHTGDISADKNILSLFRTTTQAKVKLRELAKEHKLCHKLLGLEAGTGACFLYQLGSCTGACVGKESTESYNERFTAAFESRKLKAWPYKGILMIDEKENENSGTALFIRDWALVGAFRYEGETREPLFEGADSAQLFDYDTYKILVRYILNRKNKRSIHVLSEKEFKSALGTVPTTTKEEISYEYESSTP